MGSLIETPDRQPEIPLVAPAGPDVPLQIVGDLFPGIEDPMFTDHAHPPGGRRNPILF